MKLIRATIDHFKNILNSGDIAVQADVTCIVGKNESGKTAFLQALHRLNPAQEGFTFNAQRQYPAWLEKQHRRRRKLEDATPVTASFELEDKDIAALEAKFGKGALTSNAITVSRTYGNEQVIDFKADEAAIIRHVVQGIQLPPGTAVPSDLSQLEQVIKGLAETDQEAEDAEARKQLGKRINEAKTTCLGKDNDVEDAVMETLDAMLPVFFYFDEYSQLPGSVRIRDLLQKKPGTLNPAEQTARALLDLAGAENEYLLNPDYETRKRELENVANAITHDVLTFWSTNPELRTEIDITLKQEPIANGQQQVLDELKVRLYDNRHLLSLPFEERSTGFRWFFSFLAAFSSYENSKRAVIILLDEPGLGLHARAQADFLRFIDQRLSRTCQVIYSTHSPFMVQPGKLERVRLVEDRGRESGSKVTDDVLATDKDTLFPLQGALGYDMAQHLFVAAHNLVVEGTSDFTYLSLLSSHLAAAGRTGLDSRWSIVPVGGADLVPTFVALLGAHLEVTVLVDSRKEGHQRLQQLVQQGLLKDTRLIVVGDYLKRKLGDIEDLFSDAEYLELLNKALGKKLKPADLKGSDPLVRRCARGLGVERFDHGAPATVLLRNYADILPKLSEETLARFEGLFVAINATLPKN